MENLMQSTPDALAVYRTETTLIGHFRHRKEWLSIAARGAQGYAVVQVDGPDAYDAAASWGQHISAAVNACAGIPTAALCDGVVAELLEALEGVLAWAEESKYKIDCGDSERRIWFYSTLEKARAAQARAKGGGKM
jgi:hypothetical protein